MDKNTIYIRFFKGIDQNSVNKLMETIEQKLTQEVERLIILISFLIILELVALLSVKKGIFTRALQAD